MRWGDGHNAEQSEAAREAAIRRESITAIIETMMEALPQLRGPVAKMGFVLATMLSLTSIGGAILQVHYGMRGGRAVRMFLGQFYIQWRKNRAKIIADAEGGRAARRGE